ncbi:MAG TPA: hypothetical protein VFJ85_14780 [Acidimicrobiales bacterium]|nr:hypothetical protein [Acidimicrobiales bacterium]
MSSAAELSSLATALDELAKRITAIAEAEAGARRDDLVTELYQVERSLAAAQRGLRRALGLAR